MPLRRWRRQRAVLTGSGGDLTGSCAVRPKREQTGFSAIGEGMRSSKGIVRCAVSVYPLIVGWLAAKPPWLILAFGAMSHFVWL